MDLFLGPILQCRKSVLLRRFANYLCKSVLPATLLPDCGGRCASVASLSTKLVFMVANFSIGEDFEDILAMSMCCE